MIWLLTWLLTWLRRFVFVMAVVATTSCSTSPRGRKQLVLLPEGQMSSMGAQAFDDMKSKVPVEKDPSVNSYVQCVTKPITAHVTTMAPKDGWEVVVFRDESANAFALPGGKIGVHTGLLAVAKTPSQLAAVIGHEIGHVIARHGNERVSETVVAQIGLAGVGAALNDKNPNYRLIMGALGMGAQFGLLLPHSRTQESEADLIGLELMAKAGFDPSESVTLWQNMSRSGGGQPPEFLSTHPAHGTRIANLQRTVPQVQPLYEAAPSKPRCSPPATGPHHKLSDR
ncbi:MAG: M48 family metallopeptidase [Bdellovibrionaceae bacterium]|nr:M48 family metallopeptidase [Pseudobdellovibrionaceae bacterium]